jgi:hypothetical protein
MMRTFAIVADGPSAPPLSGGPSDGQVGRFRGVKVELEEFTPRRWMTEAC